LSSCEACSEQARFAKSLRTSMRRVVATDSASSAGFESRLSHALRAERERLLATNAKSDARFAADRRRGGLLPLLLAAATTFSFVTWLNGRFKTDHVPIVVDQPSQSEASMMNPEQVLDELVDYHAAPPTPEFTEQNDALRLEPEVGVPVRVPALKQYGASWVGASVVPMKNQHAAFFRYSIGSHPVTLYIYNARRVPLRGVLEPRVVHNQPIHVGDRRGYSIAAREQRGVGYAIATDMNDDESAELVSAVF
jgi:hypothetical protein